MKSVIDDPEGVESVLRNAGFDVEVQGEGFVVSLTTRKVSQFEVADVLKCETEDLFPHPLGVLVR